MLYFNVVSYCPWCLFFVKNKVNICWQSPWPLKNQAFSRTVIRYCTGDNRNFRCNGLYALSVS